MSDPGDFGRRSVVAIVGEGAGERASPDAAFEPAAEKYAIEGRIGAGGMGEVLLVADRDLRRQIAMKVIRREAAESPASRTRFVVEAQATSQLEHPGIPPVHDIGVAPDGRLYFTMKLVRGHTRTGQGRSLVEIRPRLVDGCLARQRCVRHLRPRHG